MDVMFVYLLFWVCIVGLCLGSFFNVVILRSLSNESIVFPPSKCPKCNQRLFWWHNIPVLSYILLRGKCYFCKEKISIQYPIVEIITMLLFVISFLKFGITIKTLFVMFWVSGLLIMCVTDLKEKLVDCNIAIALAVSGFIFMYLSEANCINSLYGLLIGALIPETIARLGYVFAGTRAMGEADTYVAAALGAIVGYQNIISVLLYALITSMIFIVPLFLYNQLKSKNFVICILSFLFVVTGCVLRLYSENLWIISIFAILGVLLSVSILRSIKNVENRNYLPYVPALALGALYFIFI